MTQLKRISSILLLLLLVSGIAFSQKSANTKTNSKKETLPQKEAQLKAYFIQLQDSTLSDKDRLAICDKLQIKLREAIQDTASYSYRFDSLRFLGKIYSEDFNLRIYTWNTQMEDESMRFYGFIHSPFNETNPITELRHLGPATAPVVNKQLTLGQWYGALYYKCIPNTNDKENTDYILIGWSQLNKGINMKVIDVISFSDEQPFPVLGMKIFKGRQKTTSRVVFQYCANSNFSLKYEEGAKQKIEFDQLGDCSIAVNVGDSITTVKCFCPDMATDSYSKKKGAKKWAYKKGPNLIIGDLRPAKKE